MKAVGIKVLKNKLSEYVKEAAGGEIILVTDRDRVVAELGPPSAGRPQSAGESLLADAIRRGVVTPAVNPLVGPPPSHPVTSIEEILDDLRRDRDAR
jgi:antitoxin (DNA-binding transcriptional repressor) of toxin-antitoxin stability system